MKWTILTLLLTMAAACGGEECGYKPYEGPWPYSVDRQACSRALEVLSVCTQSEGAGMDWCCADEQRALEKLCRSAF
jgi:hypothetical protein